MQGQAWIHTSHLVKDWSLAASALQPVALLAVATTADPSLPFASLGVLSAPTSAPIHGAPATEAALRGHLSEWENV